MPAGILQVGLSRIERSIKTGWSDNRIETDVVLLSWQLVDKLAIPSHADGSRPGVICQPTVVVSAALSKPFAALGKCQKG